MCMWENTRQGKKQLRVIYHFIISGSLSVSAEKQPKSPSLVKCSLGFNIVSVIYSVTGMIFFIIDMSINSLYVYTDYYIHWSLTPGMAVSSVLLIFCLLEFCIACTAINFGCQLVCYSHNHVSMVLPNVYVATSTVIPEPANPPPTYSTEVQGSK
ncbi:membrane-spanning 4-domains subfamily A member 8-like [Pteropus medius]|uniref:membrane-spanning 4-domains subfamily A member 8-like n=1 Tax=Pteropus vampyrus TaxID=132908 RepID=UPI00196A227F|nr:membrane-spanning 4-domains subfamily A member 8-like [Pteropus giganteus]